jgi:hypothetical protein
MLALMVLISGHARLVRLDLSDIGLGQREGVFPGLDRVDLGGQADREVADRALLGDGQLIGDHLNRREGDGARAECSDTRGEIRAISDVHDQAPSCDLPDRERH